jgi:hypothetical protein
MPPVRRPATARPAKRKKDLLSHLQHHRSSLGRSLVNKADWKQQVHPAKNALFRVIGSASPPPRKQTRPQSARSHTHAQAHATAKVPSHRIVPLDVRRYNHEQKKRAAAQRAARLANPNARTQNSIWDVDDLSESDEEASDVRLAAMKRARWHRLNAGMEVRRATQRERQVELDKGMEALRHFRRALDRYAGGLATTMPEPEMRYGRELFGKMRAMKSEQVNLTSTTSNAPTISIIFTTSTPSTPSTTSTTSTTSTISRWGHHKNCRILER